MEDKVLSMMTDDSQPYSNTAIQVVLNNFTLVEIGMDGPFIFYFLIFSMFNINWRILFVWEFSFPNYSLVMYFLYFL